MIEALAAWGPGVFLRTSVWLYPLVSALHILGIGMMVCCVLLMDAAVLGLWGRRAGQQAVIAALRPVAVAALVVAALSGLLLFSVRPGEYLANPAFRLKLALLGLALANALFFIVFSGRALADGWRRGLAGLSALLWLGVLFCGRLIGFLD